MREVPILFLLGIGINQVIIPEKKLVLKPKVIREWSLFHSLVLQRSFQIGFLGRSHLLVFLPLSLWKVSTNKHVEFFHIGALRHGGHLVAQHEAQGVGVGVVYPQRFWQ